MRAFSLLQKHVFPIYMCLILKIVPQGNQSASSILHMLKVISKEQLYLPIQMWTTLTNCYHIYPSLLYLRERTHWLLICKIQYFLLRTNHCKIEGLWMQVKAKFQVFIWNIKNYDNFQKTSM